MSSANASEVFYRPGVNCIITSVKSPKEVNLRFVLGKKQYTVAYVEKKKNFDPRNLSQLLKGSDAVKASVWNIPFGPPGSNKRSWYVTDVWNPNIKGMQKKKIPEPTISIVCRIAYNLGKDFFVCELGKNFPRDVMILPRTLIYSAPAVGKGDPEIGDYLLITALIVLEGDEQRLRLMPIWAHWDRNNRGFQSIIHLNIVESGSGKSTLIVQDQTPCMWGVVQAVFKKSMKVYIPALGLSTSVPYSAVYQYVDSSIKEGQWLQLWLTPKASQPNAYLHEITTWVCSNCCIRSKNEYSVYLNAMLKTTLAEELSDTASESTKKNASAAATASKKAQSNEVAGDSQPEVMVGLAKVKQIKDKSGTLLINNTEYVFHLGIMTIYGIKMSKIKNVKIKDLVDVGCEIRYKLNAKSDGLKSVWIGPEVVTFKHLNFMPQFTQWVKARNLDSGLVKEMMREITENYDAVRKNKENEAPSKPAQPAKTKKEKKSKDGLSTCSSHTSQASLVSEGGSSVDAELYSKMNDPDAESIDLSCFPDEVGSCSSYTKEEVEELEKLWWSEDSDESDDELRPIMRPNAPSSESGDNATGSLELASMQTDVTMIENGKSPCPAEIGRPDAVKLQSSEEKGPAGLSSVPGDGSSCSPLLGAEGLSKNVKDLKLCKIDMDKADSKLGKVEMNRASNQKQDDEDLKPVTRTKQKDSGGPPSLLIMLELTKFLYEKGKAKSIPEAGELSAEFVALLEDAMSKNPKETISCTEVGTQSEITGPIISVNVRLEDEENLSRICSNGTVNNSLSLVD